MAGEEDVDITVKLKGVAKFDAEAKRTARAIDNIGDQARQAARHIAALNKTATTARLAIGPLSFKAKTGAIALGAMALGLQKLTPAMLGFAEATATTVGAGAAIGGVGLTALAQGFGVVTLASKDLTAALGGNAAALKRLDPALRGIFDTLAAKKATLQQSAISGLLPGLAGGTKSALRNFGVINSITKRTGSALGGVAQQAGGLLGSRAFGADLGRIGNTNVRILKNLGRAAISLASGFRHIVVEAGPLAEWVSQITARGAGLLDNWLAQRRAGGDLHKFFVQAKADLQVLGSIMGHTGRGIINLFGAGDIDGTKTLRSLDQLTLKFERWSKKAGQGNLGQAIADQIPKAGGLIVGALATTMAHAVPQAAKIFWQSFWAADPAGQALITASLLKKSGAFGGAAKLLFKQRGNTPASPLFVADVADIKGKGKVASAARTVGKAALPAALGVGAGVGAGVAAGIVGRQIVDPQRTTPAQRQAARFGTITIDNHIHLDGREVARSVRRAHLNDAARNSARAGTSARERALSAQYGWGY